MGFLRWLAGLVSNPVTKQISHTKFWANVAALVLTVKFAVVYEPQEWLWWAYGSMVGGYALIKRGIAAVPQVAEIGKAKERGDVE